MSFLKRLPPAIAAFFIMSAGSVYLCVAADQLASRKDIHLLGFNESIELIKSDEKCFQWWVVLEVAAFLISALIVILRNDYYKSRMIKITDSISIPEPTGQGQHGTARFMTEKEVRQKYGGYVLKNDTFVQQLENAGRGQKRTIKQSTKPPKTRARKRPNKSQAIQDLKLKANSVLPLPHLPQKTVKFPKKRTVNPHSERLEWFIQDRKMELHNTALYQIYQQRRERKKWESCKAEVFSVPDEEKETEAVAAGESENNYLNQSGLVIGYKKHGKKEHVYCIEDDIHTLIIGSTGTGKTRRIVIPTLCSLALAGESMIITDPKGEICAYTSEFLKNQGYEVCVMDFFSPEFSAAYNPLQPVIDAVNSDDITLAVTRTWDLTSFLVEKNDKSEPIWTNGETSIIAASILCVVYDNRDNPQYQNLTNVYWFIANMCKDKKIGMSTFKPIVEYVKTLPDTHPAKPLLGIADVAPSKTAGSFYTSALTTLRLFTSVDIYNITYKSDFDFQTLGQHKQVLFFILPDSKTTYYPVVTLMCAQIYDILTETAKRQGNRLKKRVNYILDEFGNFTKIADFATMLTVGRGYGIRFNMFLQSFAQLEEKYEKTGEKIIKDNCTWVCLAAASDDRKDFSERLGEYTTSSYSLGNNLQRYNQPSTSSNVNLIGRKLLMESEVGLIKNPYLLVSQAQELASIMTIPDLSRMRFNTFLGLGDRKHNSNFILYFNSHRTSHKQSEPEFWNIWDRFDYPIQIKGGFF